MLDDANPPRDGDARKVLRAASQPPMAIVELRDPDELATAVARSDEQLVTFEQLYLSSYQSLVRLAFVLTGSKEIAEDLVQDSFVRLHRHFDRVEKPASYVKQTVVNACKSHFRSAARERDRRPLLYVIDGSGADSSSSASPGDLHDVLIGLPYRQRAALVLRFYADMSENEIAEALGCRPGTVGSLIHRGLERLRAVVEQ